MATATRQCKKCQLIKPLSAFQNDPSCAGGRRATCRRCKEGKAPLESTTPEPIPTRFFRPLTGQRFIVTAAQNNTLVNEPFLAALKVAAKHYAAELVVIPYRYKNPTGLKPGRDLRRDNLCGKRVRGERCVLVKDHLDACEPDGLWWDPKVEPYLHNVRKNLNDSLTLVADVKIQATASQPLSTFESLTGPRSCIIGHPKMQFKTIPVPSGRFPKILTTTGACTERDYSNTKAGAIGEFHHYLGAVIVEIVNAKKFHLRQLNASRKDGSFTDLRWHFTPTGVTKAPRALALRMGDTHVRVTDPQVDRATFGAGGIVETLDPETIIFDDVFDGETVNPHEVGDLFLAAARAKAGRMNIRAELQQVVDFLNERAGTRNVVIVDSNHHDFLRRWVVKNLNSGCHDPGNVRLFAESVLHCYDTAQMTPGGAEYGDPFQYWIRKLGIKSNVRCLKADESFTIAGVENGMHGNHGPNGAKGSVKNLSRLGVKVNSGHGHAPAIEEGHMRSGTSTPRRQSYHRGPGSNLNTHIVTYATGARALLTIIDGEWHG